MMGLLSVLVTLSAAAFSVDHVHAELQVSEVQVSWLTNASMEIKIGRNHTDIIHLIPASNIPGMDTPCLFSGQLRGDPMSVVAVSGCMEDEEISLSISSTLLPNGIVDLSILNSVSYYVTEDEVLEISTQQPEINLLYLDSTMIVELPSFTPLTSCPVESHPVPVIDAVTAFLNTGLLVCGGLDAGYDPHSACYSQTGGSWKEEPSMMEKREGAASSIWPGHGLLVTGGYSSNGRLSSTEYLSASGQWTPGPVLPRVMYSHCQVTAGPDVFLTGGYGSGYLDNRLAGAYKLSTDDRWATLPSMTSARSNHACVVHQDYLVVIGGYGAERTVEKIKLNSLTEWEAGPGLDTGLYYGQAMVYQDTIFLVYRDGKVVKLNTEGDKWEEVADLGRDIGLRPVFPAPIVTPGAIGC